SQQPEQNQNNNGYSGFFFPFTFLFGEQQNRTRNQQTPTSQTTSNDNQTSTNENDSPQQPQGQVPQFHFFVLPMPVTPGGDGQATPNIFFFTPLFMPQESQKPRASESVMKKLPVVTITKEHLNAKASCPICFDLFGEQKVNATENGDNEATVTTEPVRKMPCNHLFCESCLFQWLRQNNTCPLCRKEIEAEGEQQQTDNNRDNNNAPLNGTNNSMSPNTETATTTPINTAQFHVSCLRTSLLVEGYSLCDINSMSRTLDFHCPTCRAPAILQSDVLKLAPAPNENENAISPRSERQDFSIFNLPITIHISDLSDSDDMDLD
ncbi:5361_t:CDS:2, partial [Funneliformis geosporum]